MVFAVLAEHRVKVKEIEKNDNKYLDVARELKKQTNWNMKVMVIPTVSGDLGTVNKGLIEGMEVLEIIGRVDTIQTTALLKSARILRSVLEIWGDLLSLKLQWKTIGSLCWEKSTTRHLENNTHKLLWDGSRNLG